MKNCPNCPLLIHMCDLQTRLQNNLSLPALLVTPRCNDQSKAEPTVPTHVPFCERQMLLTGMSASSDLSKQAALLHTHIYLDAPTRPFCPLFLWLALQKSEKFYVGLQLHEFSAVLYNPPRLKGFPNFPSPPLSLYVLSRLTSRIRGLTFKSHQRFRLRQFWCG